MQIQEIEMNDAMTERADELDNAAYQYFLTLLELNGESNEKVEKIFPWNISLLRDLLNYAIDLLDKRKIYICNPNITTVNGRQYRCSLSECGCSECHCQDEFMEKERILAHISEAMVLNGIEILESGADSIKIREETTDYRFQIKVISSEVEGMKDEGK